MVGERLPRLAASRSARVTRPAAPLVRAARARPRRPAPSRHASNAAVTASPRKRPRAVRASAPPRRSARPSRSSRPSSSRVERVLEAVERDRLVEAQAEHHPLRVARRLRQLLDLARRASARLERLQVAADRRRVAPAPVLDCADRAHAEAEVVVSEPVAEVVPRRAGHVLARPRLSRVRDRQKLAVSYQR